MSTDFVNRVHDFCDVKEWVYTPSKKNKGLFVYSISGIGKSRFISELFERELPEYKKIKVEMVGAENTTVDSFSFLSRLYRKVIETTEKGGELPLSKRIGLDPALSISHIAGINISWTNGTGYEESIVRMMEYLRDKLKDRSTSYIIDVENFHLIDPDSLECFKQLFQISNNHRFIFEFTADPLKLPQTFYRLLEELSSYLDCDIYELKKLQLEEVNVLCQRRQISYDIARDIYEEGNGNLFPLIMLQYTHSLRKSNRLLFDIIDGLSDDEQLILFVIELCKGDTPVKLVSDIFEFSQHLLSGNTKYTHLFIQSLCLGLISKGIIIGNETNVKIRQDQFLDVIAEYRKTALYYLAGNMFENYHYQKLKSGQNAGQHVLALLQVYSVFSDVRILSILPELSKLLLEQKPLAAVEKIKEIKSSIRITDDNRHLIEQLTRFLVDMHIAIGQWSAALELVEGSYSEDIPWQACYISAVLAANPGAPNAECRIMRMREKHRKNLNAHMSITVSLHSYYLRTLEQQAVKCIGEEYLREFCDQENLNYAFLLKNQSNTMDDKNAIKALNHCNRIFTAYERQDLVAMNNITIASRMVYMGELEGALTLLNETEEEIKKSGQPIRLYYFYNNRAAMHLLQGDYDKQTERELVASELLADSAFEKAIVLCNRIIYHLLTEDKEQARLTLQRLQALDLSCYHNIDLKFIITKNYLFYCDQMGYSKEAEKAKEELHALYELSGCPNDIRQEIVSLFKGCKKKIKQHFLANFPYHPDFIGYWQYEVCCDSSSENHLTALLNRPDIEHSAASG